MPDPGPVERVTPFLRCMREVHLTDPAGNRVRVGWRSGGD